MPPHSSTLSREAGDREVDNRLNEAFDPDRHRRCRQPAIRHGDAESMLAMDLVTGDVARVEVQNSPDGVTYSRVHRYNHSERARPADRVLEPRAS